MKQTKRDECVAYLRTLDEFSCIDLYKILGRNQMAKSFLSVLKKRGALIEVKMIDSPFPKGHASLQTYKLKSSYRTRHELAMRNAKLKEQKKLANMQRKTVQERIIEYMREINKPIGSKEFVDFSNVPHSTASQALKRLIEKGLVEVCGRCGSSGYLYKLTEGKR